MSLNSDPELLVAVVALVISVFAFVIAIFQALQQYYASATGYASCKYKVIGPWFQFTRRRFKWTEFRFEVEFQVPIIFVSSPKNPRGPQGDHDQAEITYLVGTTKSYEKTFTWKQETFNEVDSRNKAGKTREAIHTADNEVANWMSLLMAIQRMEKDSRTWQDDVYLGHNPHREDHTYCHPNPANQTPHTLTVGLQRKKRSWDSMPDNMKKPYATTTISHLIEIAAMLGIYWKEFNLNEDRYRAQGNGFSIAGYDVDDLGIVFTFQKTGPTWFEDNRVVPHNSVKELSFGYCPTIFRQFQQSNKIYYKYTEEPKDIRTLQLGSMSAIAETLVVIGCNTNTVNYFRRSTPETRHGHLFPIAFELLGMLGIIIQVPGTYFRMLPNPTIWPWDRKAFSLRTLLNEYSHAFREAPASELLLRVAPGSRTDEILKMASDIEDKFDDLQSQNGEQMTPELTADTEEKFYSSKLISGLRGAIENCDDYLKKEEYTGLIQSVLRVHLQEVLGILNDGDEELSTTAAAAEAYKSNGDRKRDLEVPGLSAIAKMGEEKEELPKGKSLLQTLDAASSSERHSVLVDIYVGPVRKRVIERVCRQLRNDRARKEVRQRGARSIASEASTELAIQHQEQQINNVWCTLVFRMICWLLLHDFHEKDIQIDKSEVYGSRLPVYIT
ncbi:hypothetical protein CCHL11_03549 [Colletotrichum chlorophyti]|uniref:Modin n=1 Tax=Colletotrichum chlorophyti TaxID=708187 RepID=A0A1Q8RSA8_9PEZI|nr:hypothetical protein CCHL11_03549 [Colletotrichum chlorophyti]